jgi:hypothetical protein
MKEFLVVPLQNYYPSRFRKIIREKNYVFKKKSKTGRSFW